MILATGTYLDARIIPWEVSYSGGPNGLFPAKELTKNLMDLGLKIRRF